MTDFLPYGKQHLTEDDIAAVAAALRDPLITQGPQVEAFERAFAADTGARHAIAFSSGTAALHGAAHAAGIQPGRTLLTSALSFVASANCALFCGGQVRFGDVDPETANLDLEAVDIGDATAIVAVSLAGLPVDLRAAQPLRERGVVVIEDACHALGGQREGRPIGGDGMADMYCFSLHPVKAMTTGEGGAVTTDSDEYAAALREFRTHGIRRGAPDEDPLRGPWHYDVAGLGWNYRITDFQCALGLSQLQRLSAFIDARNRVAEMYRERLSGMEGLRLPASPATRDRHGYHLFVVRFEEGAARRRQVFESLREQGIGSQLHYIPIYRHGLYRSLGFASLRLPNTEAYYEEALSLPMYPSLTEVDVERVGAALEQALSKTVQVQT